MLPTTRRRQALTLLALAWIAHGLTILHQPGWRDIDEAIIFEYWPVSVRVAIWVGFGLLTIGAARVAGRDPRWQSVSWALVIVPPMIRLTSYLWSVLMWIIPGAPGGEPAAIAYAVWWAAIVVLVWLIATWPEVPRD